MNNGLPAQINQCTMFQTATMHAVSTVSVCTRLLRSMVQARPDLPTSMNSKMGESSCASATTLRDLKAAWCGLSPKPLPLILPDEMPPPLPLPDPPIPNPLLCTGLVGHLMLGGECGGEGEVRIFHVMVSAGLMGVGKQTWKMKRDIESWCLHRH